MSEPWAGAAQQPQSGVAQEYNRERKCSQKAEL